MAREVAWKQITRNLDLGLLDAVCVTATEIATGRVVSFVQTRGLEAPDWTHDEAIVARAAELTIEHALASAAIPVLFPAVRVGETYYADGGLRLNTPLAPTLRLGADRVLVVALRHSERDGWHLAALFSNTARAHELGKTQDWVVIFYSRDGDEGQCTVVTEPRGPLVGRRVVRGREAECHAHYASLAPTRARL